MTAAQVTTASRLRGRYLVRNPMLFAYLRVIDVAFRTVRVIEERASTDRPIRRALLGIGGRLGDAIIATSAIESLRRALPEVEIGLVTSTAASRVFAGDERIAHIHCIDHWRLSSKGSAAARFRHHRHTASRAQSEIRATGYDVGFDLYPYFPNFAVPMWRAGVPRRIGFTSGGGGPLYTASLDWRDDHVHIAEQQARLLRLLIPQLAFDTPLPYVLTAVDDNVGDRVRARLARLGVSGGYVVIHPGAGTRVKEWPKLSWKALVARLLKQGRRVVLTGAGAAERAVTNELADGRQECINLADELTWEELTAVVARADIVIAGDTSVSHLAAAMRTPHVVIYAGINSMAEWRPLSSKEVPSTVLMHDVPCSPCYRGHGCETMACIRGVSVDRVVAAADAALAAR